jgi:hypothetical protein
MDPRRAKVGRATVTALCEALEGTFADLEKLVIASRKMRTDSIARLLGRLPKWRYLKWNGVHPHVLPRLRSNLQAIDEDLRRAGGGWSIEMNPLRIVVEVRGRIGLSAVADWEKAGVVDAGDNEEETEEAEEVV